MASLPQHPDGADAGTVTTSAPHPDRTHRHDRPAGGPWLLLAAVSGTAAVSLLARLLGA